MLADVTAMWQMEWPLLGGFISVLSSEMLSRTSSQYVRQMVFAYVLVEGWIIHPYVYCFFDSSDQVLVPSSPQC